jgi:hypothetical protein
MSRKYFSFDPKGRFPRHPAPLTVKTLVGGCAPGLVLRCSISAVCIFIGGDDADRFQKLCKPCGCTVSTMGLSEARGLVLFRVIRGGIGVTQRLGATGTVSTTGHSHTHPRTRASPEPTDYHQKKITGDGRGSSPETLKPVRMLLVALLSKPPFSAVRRKVLKPLYRRALLAEPPDHTCLCAGLPGRIL